MRNQNKTNIFFGRRCMSIPVTMRSIVKKGQLLIKSNETSRISMTTNDTSNFAANNNGNERQQQVGLKFRDAQTPARDGLQSGLRKDFSDFLKFGNFVSYLQNVNYYWNTWNGVRPAKNINFVNPACEQKHLGISGLNH